MSKPKDDLISRSAALNAVSTCGICIQRLLDIPDVDAVPVVRCKDCKYGKLGFDANGQGLIQCTNPYYPAAFAETWPFDLDWYCAGGERRDEGETGND